MLLLLQSFVILEKIKINTNKKRTCLIDNNKMCSKRARIQTSANRKITHKISEICTFAKLLDRMRDEKRQRKGKMAKHTTPQKERREKKLHLLKYKIK